MPNINDPYCYYCCAHCLVVGYFSSHCHISTVDWFIVDSVFLVERKILLQNRCCVWSEHSWINWLQMHIQMCTLSEAWKQAGAAYFPISGNMLRRAKVIYKDCKIISLQPYCPHHTHISKDSQSPKAWFQFQRSQSSRQSCGFLVCSMKNGTNIRVKHVELVCLPEAQRAKRIWWCSLIESSASVFSLSLCNSTNFIF